MPEACRNNVRTQFESRSASKIIHCALSDSCFFVFQTLEPLGDVVVKSPKSEEDPLEIVKLQIPLEIKQESDWEASLLGKE